MSNLKDCRVLIVEDEMFVALDHEATLRGIGCTGVATAGTIKSALEKVHGWHPDIVILDLNLHGEQTFPVADALDDAHVPFVIVSGYSRRILPARHENRPFLDKPSRPHILVKALQDALDAQASSSNGGA
jgi:CheY-like chemotaxis protein